MSMAIEPIGASRRGFLKATIGAASAAVWTVDTVLGASEEPRIRDRLWIWTHVAGSHDEGWNIPASSRMTPAEGAFYLGVRNVLFIRYEDRPVLDRFDQYAISFRPLDRVVWSLTGAGGATGAAEQERVLELSGRFPNIAGFVLDDFFRSDGTAALTVEQLRALRERAVIDGQRRDLYVVFYDHQLDAPVDEHLRLCDKITFWTWQAKDLEHLRTNFGRLEKRAPDHGKLLGCYLWDYGGGGRPMPLELIQKQCRLGLQWLEEERIEGMIFLSNNVCDLGLDAVEYVRKWIDRVGNQGLGGKR